MKTKNMTAMNFLFLILLFLAIIGLFIAIITILDNKEMLSKQPIDYVMEKYDFVSCSCTNAEGELFQSGYQVIEVEEVMG